MQWIDRFYEAVRDTEITTVTVVIKLFFSLLLGGMIGTERQLRRHEAGIRTFTLICLGATAAMLISIWIPQSYPDFLNGDPGRIAAQVLSGIGFLGAGAIIQSKGSIRGLTTAACIWVVAVIGMAVGAGMYLAAFLATLLTLFVLISLERLERKMWIAGVNKILIIACNTAFPDVEKIRQLLVAANIYIVGVSYENDYERDEAVISFTVHVKSRSSYRELFMDLHALGYVKQVKLLN